MEKTEMKTLPIFSACLMLFLSGCQDKIQIKVLDHILEPFRVPQEQTARTDFFKEIRQRCNLPENVGIVDYDYNPILLVNDKKKEFCDSAVIVVTLLASSINGTGYVIHEEWYHADTLDPILLRRRVNQVHDDQAGLAQDMTIKMAVY